MKPFPKMVLMIDNDQQAVETVRPHLRNLPADLISLNSGQDGLDLMTRQSVDLCILNSHLSDMRGVELCRQIRQFDQATPILIMATTAQEADKVEGLEAGADDYLTKPFGVAEFMARVKAMLRRSSLGLTDSQADHRSIVCGAMRIDVAARMVTIKDQRVELTPKEFDLLALLARNPGKSYRRQDLLRQVWHYRFDGYEHTLTAHVNRLRNKIEPDFARPTYIFTTWGVGYRFADPASVRRE